MTQRQRKIVVLGMMSKIPVAGVIWQTVHYLEGLRRLGYDVYYVEAHARTPSMLMTHESDDGSVLAASFIERTLARFGFADHWAYVALHADGACYGMSSRALSNLYRSAEIIINLHGGTLPRPEHYETGRLIYLETDPVQLQVELADGIPETTEFLEPHVAFFTFAENLGRPGCSLPVSEAFEFVPTRQPVVLDFWPVSHAYEPVCFTTVANWRQEWRSVQLAGETYQWSKHHEFEKVIDLPRLAAIDVELALSGCDDDAAARLRAHGWHVRDAGPLSSDIDRYRDYISGSSGEFTVAKDQNVRLRTGWFSDRSATYLASGRPVVTQDTGSVVPVGEGLLVFTTVDGAAAALQAVRGDHARHGLRARALAEEYFAHDRVLGELLAHVGLSSPPRRWTRPFPADLEIVPTSRRPTTLAPDTLATLRAPLRNGPSSLEAVEDRPDTSIIVVTHDGLPFTRLCLETLLALTDEPRYELIVVDNASTDGTRDYVRDLVLRSSRVRLLLNDTNAGFPAAVNQGLAAATGNVLVLLNNDTIPTAGWLSALVRHLDEPTVGLVGPVTNRIGNEAEIQTTYRTYGELLEFAADRMRARVGESFELRTPAMFCLAMRRDVYVELGPLDESYGLGTLEDDDYAMRARRAGYRTVCADDVFVHHFGEASFGRLFATGQYSRLLDANRSRFERKWGEPWLPYERRHSNGYDAMKQRIRELVESALPGEGTVIVVSRGDEDLVRFQGRQAWHFPRMEDGVYAGCYPAHSDEAIEHLEALRESGGDYVVFPGTSRWWLDHYAGLRNHLVSRYVEVVNEDACVVYGLRPSREGHR